jgi:lysophospholipase L1-like esterase
MRGRLFYLAYLVASVTFLVLLIEGAGRAIIHFKYGRPGKSYGLWIGDRELGATHRPNGYNTQTSLNAQGFRNQEEVFEPKPAGSLRIVAFGGSTTFGYNLRDGETFTEHLEARLRQEPGYEKTQVLNAGRITYSAGHNLMLMKRLVPSLRPDYALVYEGVNELYNAWVLQRDGQPLDGLGVQYGVIGRSYDQNRWLKRNSVIVRYVDYVVKARLDTAHKEGGVGAEPSPSSQFVHPWVVANYRHVLQEMLVLLHRLGTVPIVFRYPSVGHAEQRMFSDLSAEIAQGYGIPVLDLESRFERLGERKRRYFIHTGVHVTEEGARIIADEAAAFILLLEKQRAVH